MLARCLHGLDKNNEIMILLVPEHIGIEGTRHICENGTRTPQSLISSDQNHVGDVCFNEVVVKEEEVSGLTG